MFAQFLTLATAVLVPLYVDPNASWTTVANAKHTYPSVPLVAIINPASGPGPHSRLAGFISYAVPALDPAFDKQASAYVGYEYVTNQRLPNPYGALPPYFMQLVASLVGTR